MEILFIYGRRRKAKLLKAQCDFVDTLEIYDRNMSIAYQRKQSILSIRTSVKFRLVKARERCLEICKDNYKGNLSAEQHTAVTEFEHLRKLYQSLTTRFNSIQAMYLKINQMKVILQETYMNAELSDDLFEITKDLKTAKTNTIQTVIDDCNEKLLKNAEDMTQMSERIKEFEDKIDLEGFTEKVNETNASGNSKRKQIKTVNDLRVLLQAPDDEDNVSFATVNLEKDA
jgi:hypothetical protein